MVCGSTVTDAEQAFAAACELQRRVLRLHCYRMTGSVDDAEDLVQETLLRAWRARDSWQRADAAELAQLLRDDVRWAMPPAALWFEGRAAVEQLLTLYPMHVHGEHRLVAVGANRQRAAAGYLRPHGGSRGSTCCGPRATRSLKSRRSLRRCAAASISR